ncbi:NB-ARC domain-containing protein [Limnospira platensis]|jgi:hypothetical protein|uniref:NB-ARC domain-containing protein n=1 Tax=Limnospira platensis TaxID=118562 RepID=UPI0001D0E5AA|nr:ATPase [Arthrospira platensis YZ]MDF2212484.1 NB-ARC domain-containing protein [Arthrospira platensis NCB002]QQW27486.1 NB-ARC domain-containing protein [Arthrospira sp. PCC 9108]BAI91953.1 hypothetical protein NIES39_K03060 [Arthrospira platensis NIES-39]BDT14285.1 hypothetical protein N39L_40080 [Arthrospira platensis NIES-39]
MDIQEVLNWTDEQVFTKTGKHLDWLQKSILQGIWQHQDYYEIAANNEKSYDHVKKEAWKLWKLLSDVVGEDVKKSNVFSVLEQAELSATGNSTNFMQIGIGNNQVNICSEQHRSPSDLSSSHSPTPQDSSPIIDLTDAPDLTEFYSRTSELTTLKQWILQDHTRLITIYGLSGIGKSLLTRQLIEQIKTEFDYMMWRSLSDRPTLSSLKNQLQQFFAQSQQPSLPTIIDYLRHSRCLVILDDLHNLFKSGELAGEYLTDYKEYRTFFRQIAKNHHQSCVILISWEKPREIATLEAEKHSTRTLHLKGLSADAEKILRSHQLTDSDKWPELINLYQGHPTWLNIIASTIVELFDGSVSLFLSYSEDIFLGDLEPILESHLERLSDLEQQVISGFRKNQAIALSQKPTNPELSQSELWSAIQSLVRRGLLEKISEGERGMFQLHPIWQQYLKFKLS